MNLHDLQEIISSLAGKDLADPLDRREAKQSQLKRLRHFKARHKDESGPMLARLQQAVIDNTERVRGAGGRGAGLFAGANYECVV